MTIINIVVAFISNVWADWCVPICVYVSMYVWDSTLCSL